MLTIQSELIFFGEKDFACPHKFLLKAQIMFEILLTEPHVVDGVGNVLSKVQPLFIDFLRKDFAFHLLDKLC